jgi:hypothetical protein
MHKISALLASVFIAASSLAFSSARPAPQPVLVPVVFAGVQYAAEEFNAIYRQFGAPLHFVALSADGVLFAFRSTDAARQFIEAHSQRPARSKGLGLAAPVARPAASHGCGGHMLYDLSRFFIDINCGGSAVGAYAPSEWATMPSGWNDVVSSLACAYDPATWYCVLYQHSNYGGSSLWTVYNTYKNDLRDWGFNDITSSLIVYTYP